MVFLGTLAYQASVVILASPGAVVTLEFQVSQATAVSPDGVGIAVSLAYRGTLLQGGNLGSPVFPAIRVFLGSQDTQGSVVILLLAGHPASLEFQGYRASAGILVWSESREACPPTGTTTPIRR